MVMIMKNIKYDRTADLYKADEHRVRNFFLAFLVGGLVGFLGELIIEILINEFHISRSDASTFMIMFFILFASLCTALGFFDKWVGFAKAGLIIPITGFAPSTMSAALDYRKEGSVTGLGASMFKLAGTVIIFGVVSAYVFGLLRILLFGGQI